MERLIVLYARWVLVLALGACSSVPPSNVKSNARVTPSTAITRDLTQLPEPKQKIAVAVYGFRDQTGQYKASPDSLNSTLVTQGAATILVKALRDSGWYIPVEREGLNNLLTERRIIRAIEVPNEKGKPLIDLPNLTPASMIIEGGVIGYESNVRTGGKGANYLGIGISTQYRVDQVTVGLRSIDIRTGQVINTASVTKTIFSYQFDTNIYKFVDFQKLLQTETGFTTNEPAQLAVREAIEAAVIHLTVQAVRERVLELKNERDWTHPVIQAYLAENVANLQESGTVETDEPIPMNRVTRESQAAAIKPILLEADSAPVATRPAPAARTGAAPPTVSAPPGVARPPAGPSPSAAPVAAPPVAPAPPLVPAAAAAAAPGAAAKTAVPEARLPAVEVPAQRAVVAPPPPPAPNPAARPTREPEVAVDPRSAGGGGGAPIGASPPARPQGSPAAKPPAKPPARPPSATDDIFNQYWIGK